MNTSEDKTRGVGVSWRHTSVLNKELSQVISYKTGVPSATAQGSVHVQPTAENHVLQNPHSSRVRVNGIGSLL